MSVYVVDRGHIRYLIDAAWMLRQNRHESPGMGRYYHNGECHEVNELTLNRTGLMLWEECRKSVSARYPDDADDELPGPCDDGPRFGYVHPMHSPATPINPLQVLMSVNCYEYQSCEHDGWNDSEARSFCDALRAHAIRSLPGYSDMEWGAPKGWETPRPAGLHLVSA